MLRPCLHPGCPELVETGYCDTHRPAGRARSDSTARGYGHRWSELARAYRTTHPVCERCRRRPSKIVHHKDGLGPRGPRGYDPTNLEAVCGRCHTEQHRTLARAGRGTPPGKARTPPPPSRHRVPTP